MPLSVRYCYGGYLAICTLHIEYIRIIVQFFTIHLLDLLWYWLTRPVRLVYSWTVHRKHGFLRCSHMQSLSITLDFLPHSVHCAKRHAKKLFDLDKRVSVAGKQKSISRFWNPIGQPCAGSRIFPNLCWSSVSEQKLYAIKPFLEWGQWPRCVGYVTDPYFQSLSQNVSPIRKCCQILTFNAKKNQVAIKPHLEVRLWIYHYK